MTTWNPAENVLISDSEDEELESRNFKGREALLFVVDGNLSKTPERFAESLDIIKNAFISGMMVNDKELMGLMFVNTEHSSEPFEPNCLDDIVVPANCAVFLPLRQLTKSIVEHYLRFQIVAAQQFEKDYGVSANNASFAAMIRLCVSLFDHSTFALRQAKIVLLTDKSTPHAPQSHEYQMALQKATDLEGRLIEFYLIPMIDDFDYEPFYKEFLSLVRDVEIDSFVVPDAKQQREILTERKLKQDFNKRCLGHFNFVLGPKLEISAQYYNYYQRRCFPRKIRMLRKDNTLVERKFIMTVSKEDPETEELIEKRDLKMTDGWYEINLGGMPIRISMERLNRVRNLHPPQMMLLGFKPLSTLPENMYYKPCNFMYPDDQKIIGSKRLFRALWERCLEREKMAICIFMRKRKSKPRYVALIPISAKQRTAEESTSRQALLIGEGFKIVYLPFYKHIRNIDFADYNSIENSASEEGVHVFEKIVKKLKINYKPEQIGDPVLDKLQAKLIGMALDIRTEFTDTGELADPEVQDERIKHLLPEYQTLFSDDPETTAQKRRATKEPGVSSAPKMPKLTDEDLDDFNKIREHIKNNCLNSCTKGQLSTILEKHFDLKLAKSTTKQVFIDRINEFINL